MTLTSKLTVSVAANLVQTLDLAEARVPLLKDYAAILATGTGASQADKVFHDQRTLGPSAFEDLDLNGPALLDPLNVALAFLKVKGLVVMAAAANVNNVQVGGAAANGFITPFGSATDKVVLRPGAVMALFAGQADATGYALTAATADLLRITNGGAGTSVTYDVIIIGTSV